MRESDGFDGERALAHLTQLATGIGARLKGSDGERLAADTIAGWFEELGLRTRRQAFPVRTFGAIETRLEVLQPRLGTIPCEQLGLARDTPAGGVEGELIFLDDASPASIGPEVGGRIVVVMGRFSGEALGRLAGLAPLGVVSIGDQLGVPPVRTSQWVQARAHFGAVPTVSISHENGLTLLQAGAARARLVARSEEADGESQNVIGELVGLAHPDEIVVVGGHYDTVTGVQGASDNAGGIALMVELARLFAARGSRRTLRFVAFGAEEGGLVGSMHYVRQLEATDRAEDRAGQAAAAHDRSELANHRLCLNIDVQGVLLGTNRAHVQGPADLATAVRLLSSEMGPPFEIVDQLCSSDGNSFSARGIPSVSFVRKGPASQYLHTPNDRIEYVGAGPLAAQGRLIEAFLQRYVAGARAFPFERTIPDAQRARLAAYFEQRGAGEYCA